MRERIVDANGYPLPGFFDLFSRRDELAVQEIEVLKQILASLKTGVPAGQAGQVSVGQVAGVGRLRRVTLHDHLRPRQASTTFYPSLPLADLSEARESVLIVVMSTCDQALTVQAIGSLGSQADAVTSFTVGASQALAAAAMVGLGIDLSVNWYPYLGVSVTSGIGAPAVGDVTAWAFVRRF